MFNLFKKKTPTFETSSEVVNKENSQNRSGQKQSSSPVIDADDFFKDIDHKKAISEKENETTKEIEYEIESPKIDGLRETTLPHTPSILSSIDTGEIDISMLGRKEQTSESTYKYADTIETAELEIEKLFEAEKREKEEKNQLRDQKEKEPHKFEVNDFFKDMGNHQSTLLVEESYEIDIPEINGLREEPKERIENIIDEINIYDIDTSQLIDKSVNC